jgi:outer membrane protein insertion porin family
MLAACSNTKHIPKNDRLFRGSKVVIHDNEATRKEKKVLKNDLAGIVRPRPNTKFLGFRLKLSLYNLAGGDPGKKKGIRNWLRNKVGEPPVLASSVHLDVNRNLMVNLLQNRGFFHATARARFDSAIRKKTRAIFDINTGPQYTINKVVFRKDSSLISNDIDSDFNKTLLLPGNSYNLDVIKAERARIDRMLKEKGYYFFKPDYILVLVDSTIGNHKVDMYVKLKHNEIPDEAYRVYTINDIYIYANYRLRGEHADTSKANRVKVDDYYIIDNRRSFKPQTLADAMIFEKGEEYSLDDQNTSLSRLINMGTFKFVKNRFDPIDDTLLDVYYYLTSFPKKSLRSELGVLSQNDNRTGTRGSLSWRNRNAFRGAEELVFKLNAGIETQYSTISQAPIYTFGGEISLAFPRFVVPFADIQNKSRYLPRSIIKLKANYETELNMLSIYSYTASYGYDWKEGPHKEHQLYPINFTYVQTDTLAKTEQLHLVYNSLIYNGIIFGPTYEYTYNSQVGISPKSGFYFDGLIDLGIGAGGLQTKQNNQQTSPAIGFAQYIKLQPDLRYYWHISPASTIAARALVGIGIPYGSSTQLPNIKQFWAGGNSDLRGFPSRLVGPGTFNEYSVYNSSQYIETLGDLKLEFNAELRQHIYKFVNAGLFADAGNIWLYNDNPAYPGGKFTGNFYQQLAADVGIGIRLDFSILLLRFDFGFPIYKPWTSGANNAAPNTGTAANPVLNIAIGYPF